MTPISYDTFISYSHAKDKPIAAALQAAIQRLGKPWYRRRALRVFRDDTSLSATPSLWPSITQALDRSRFFILLASPEAASSHWVGREVSYWLDHKGARTLLIALTDGSLVWDDRDDRLGNFNERECPLPPVLVERLQTEPKWVDLRTYRHDANPRDARFIEHAADLAATIRGMPKDDLLSNEVRQQRRALSMAWSAASVLLVLAGTAAWQWNAAVKAERLAFAEASRAERNFGAAKENIDAVIFELVFALRNIEGMTAETGRRVLTRAEASVEKLSSQTEGDPRIRSSQGAMFGLFSDTYMRLGDSELAREYAQKQTEVYRGLAVKDPGNREWLHNLVVSLNYEGDSLRALGEGEKALVAYREGLDIARILVSHDLNNALWQRGVLASLDGIGDVLMAQTELVGALAAYRESLEIARALVTCHPNEPRWYEDVSRNLNALGDVQIAQGNNFDALIAYRESLDIRRALAGKDDGNLGYQRDMSVSLTRVGGALQNMGDLTGAATAYREALDKDRTLANKDPTNTERQRNVAVSLDGTGYVLLKQGDPVGAMVAWRESLDILRALTAKDPNNIRWQTDLVMALIKVAFAGDDFSDRIKEAIAILTRLKSYGRLTEVQEAWIGKLEAKLAAPQPVSDIGGTYLGTNIQIVPNAGTGAAALSGQDQISLTFQQSGSEISATYQTSLGGRGRGSGTIKGNVVNGIVLQSAIESCPGSIVATLIFSGDAVSWIYDGRDCVGPAKGRGQAKKVVP